MSGARPWLRSESMRSLMAAIGDRDHPALARRQLLVGVEAEGGRMAAGADPHPVAVHGAQRLAGVLDDRQAHALEGGQVGRVAEDVHRQQRGGAVGDGGRRRVGIEVQGARVDVGEDRPRPLEEHGVGARDEREGRGDDLVAVRDADGPQAQVQPGRPARHRARVLGADPGREGLLEGGHPRPERQLPRAQDLDDRGLLLRPEHGLGERDDLGRGVATSALRGRAGRRSADVGPRSHTASVGVACAARPPRRPGCSA